MKKTLGIVMMTAIVSCINISQTQASQASCFDGISDRIESAADTARTFYNNLPDDDDLLDGTFFSEMGGRFNRWVRPRPTNPVSRIFQSGTDFVQDTSRGLSHQLNRRFR